MEEFRQGCSMQDLWWSETERESAREGYFKQKGEMDGTWHTMTPSVSCSTIRLEEAQLDYSSEDGAWKGWTIHSNWLEVDRW